VSHPYDPRCPHCIPAIVNMDTGVPYEMGSPVMVQVLRVWNAAPFKVRQAFIAVTSDDSRAPEDMQLVEPLMEKLTEAIRVATDN